MYLSTISDSLLSRICRQIFLARRKQNLRSGSAFLFGFAILSMMVWNAQLLVSLGLTGNFYYVLLLALGLSAAVVLFGVLQSRAIYRGNTGWGRLELGGAIVGCAQVGTPGHSRQIRMGRSIFRKEIALVIYLIFT